MKSRLLIGLLLILILSACSGDVYELAYTARGDSANILALTNTDIFQRTDDLNVVVRLGSHNDTVDVSATFFDPDGNQEGETLTVKADKDTGMVILGLDFEQRPSGEDWQLGLWRIEIRIDGEKVDDVEFRIQ
ncbi:MAG: hypothetical protein H6673_05315 [Anaerolineales bacterium]|nr:hypothetical protein [Anaerolineales bacterium]